ncbi:MAG TPA: DUF3592 domain-containing protein [Gammaproteobacteria bacterium]
MADYIIPALFILVGIWMFKAFFRARRKIAASRLWVSTTGRIRDISIRERMKRSGTDRHWILRMTFEYEVGGRMYEGDQSRTAFSRGGSFFHTEAQAREAVAALEGRDPFTVFYDPGNPADCVLEREEAGSTMKIALMALAFLFIGFAVLAHAHWKQVEPWLQ